MLAGLSACTTPPFSRYPLRPRWAAGSALAADVAGCGPASVVVEVEDERLQFDPAIRQASQCCCPVCRRQQGGSHWVIGVPVIGNTGIQTGATEAMGAMLAAGLSTLRPDLRLRPFSSDSLAARPGCCWRP